MHDYPRVLVVDDDVDIVRGLCVRLRAAGYAVDAAADAVAGLQLAASGRPAVILVDIRMPGMDGFGFLEGLRKLDQPGDVPVIVMSANVAEHTRTRVLAAGARCFVQKPFQSDRLMATIGELVRPGRRDRGAAVHAEGAA